MRFTQSLLPSAGWTEFAHTRRESPGAFEEMKDAVYVIELRMDRVACSERTKVSPAPRPITRVRVMIEFANGCAAYSIEQCGSVYSKSISIEPNFENRDC